MTICCMCYLITPQPFPQYGNICTPSNSRIYPFKRIRLRIYNYSKTPARGARDFSIEVDGRLLYMGTVDAALEDSKYNMALPDSKK